MKKVLFFIVFLMSAVIINAQTKEVTAKSKQQSTVTAPATPAAKTAVTPEAKTAVKPAHKHKGKGKTKPVPKKK